jgi:hypothetical protein
MKKLLLTLLLLFSLFVSAQETFTRRYNHYYSSLLEKKGEGQATFVINDGESGKITVYLAQKPTKTLYQLGEVVEDRTDGGYRFQLITAVDEKGRKIVFQLFDNSVRMFFESVGYIEYFNE